MDGTLRPSFLVYIIIYFVSIKGIAVVAIFLCAMVSHLFFCLWRNLDCSGIYFAVKIM